MKKILLVFIIFMLSGCSIQEEKEIELKYENPQRIFDISDNKIIKSFLEPILDIIKTKEIETTLNSEDAKYENKYYILFDGYIEVKIDKEEIEVE